MSHHHQKSNDVLILCEQRQRIADFINDFLQLRFRDTKFSGPAFHLPALEHVDLATVRRLSLNQTAMPVILVTDEEPRTMG